MRGDSEIHKIASLLDNLSGLKRLEYIGL